ncbi:protein GLUTAMINE DUMPER 5-like [Rutidosis leptorrhynchoides]|uniref:protein GLUTAMINE DUMPER 5-like n=1 Tax=Rutidosis leptorrhynchoides TaxID=125765 RepID=UPI003A9A3099
MKATALTATPSPWHTPVPYLLGALAVLLGLIAFALLMQACSYFNLAEDIQNAPNEERDLEGGDSKLDNHKKKLTVDFEEKYLVIMAGQARPTFLATPISSGSTLFVGCRCQRELMVKSSTSNVEIIEEINKDGFNDHQLP